jgi:hypothetical protein
VTVVLGIETSCDETGVGLVQDGVLLGDALASSMDEHARFGGVVPEIAARAHLQAMLPVTKQALSNAGRTLDDVGAILNVLKARDTLASLGKRLPGHHRLIGSGIVIISGLIALLVDPQVVGVDELGAVLLVVPELRPTKVVESQEGHERGHLFQGPVVGPARMSVDTSRAVYEEAGLGPDDVDIVQVHDAFAIEELEYYELLGLCKTGEAEKCIERGDFELGGRCSVSTDGGLIARGHPGGPTGLAQLWETTLQLRGEAGARQVKRQRTGENARTGLCHMMGGGSVCVIHILQRD